MLLRGGDKKRTNEKTFSKSSQITLFQMFLINNLKKLRWANLICHLIWN